MYHSCIEKTTLSVFHGTEAALCHRSEKFLCIETQKAIRSDLSATKLMAMLVFTDFACWPPIAFFGLTVIVGLPLIDVTNSKILLVFFFYLLNSYSNLFLYTILPNSTGGMFWL
ncbi:thyrotropin receptor [Caerostris darwini]|uniref:Thyrotropin receptor n=1 Tax=Caerostris darwini TaxID=1538125 RepID=A0AAV4W9L9_9ARAC|nr:thyrotropin receptor [Caerostris darwini]